MVYLILDGVKFLALFAKFGDAMAFFVDIKNDFPPHSRIVNLGNNANINGPDGTILATMREYDLSKLGVPIDQLTEIGLDHNRHADPSPVSRS